MEVRKDRLKILHFNFSIQWEGHIYKGCARPFSQRTLIWPDLVKGLSFSKALRSVAPPKIIILSFFYSSSQTRFSTAKNETEKICEKVYNEDSM